MTYDNDHNDDYGKKNDYDRYDDEKRACMIIVFTGNGKGKTTAALGQAVRVLGRGKTALMIQFIKGPWKSGEDNFGAQFQIPNDKFQVRKMGLGFVGILGDKLPREEHERAAQNALQMFREEFAKKTWDLIILDEVNVAIDLKLVSTEEVLDVLKDVVDEEFVLCTGRGAPQELIDRADLVTEMREVKHPFNDQKLAKIMVEF